MLKNKDLNDTNNLSLDEFVKLDSFTFAMGSHSAREPSWESRNPGVIITNIKIWIHGDYRIEYFFRSQCDVSGV